jgi:hypothetical protein
MPPAYVKPYVKRQKNDMAARACLAALGTQLLSLKKQIGEFDRMIMAWHRSNQTSKRLHYIPGVGPMLATALVEGLEITWELSGDRLKRPAVVPMLETHLTMVKPKEGFDPRFCLPQASVRFTSMVKALFDFDPGGYRAPLHRDGKLKNRGDLHYPEEFRRVIELEKLDVPQSILMQAYPILPQE